jgi:hypothetical protein
MWRGAVLCAGALVFAAGTAQAQQAPGERPSPPQAVDNWGPSSPQLPQGRTQPTSSNVVDPWDPFYPRTPGIPAGQGVLYPSVTAGAFYDDNVFATHSNKQGSAGAVVRPELGYQVSGQNYAVQTQGFVEDRQYARFSSEDQLNGGAGLTSTFMPDSNTQLVGKLRYLHAHEDRGTGDSLFTIFDKPVAYNTFEASGAVNKRFDRWWTSVGVAGSWTNYETPTIGGIGVDQSYRDGSVGVLTGRVGYVVAPLTSVFAEVAANDRNFDVNAFDSTGYRVVGGLLLEQGPGAHVKGEVYAGYMNQNYTGDTFQTVSTYTYGGSLAWLIAPRWTAVFEGKRDALESDLNGGVSLVESLAGARLDYLIMTNLVFGAGVTYLVDDFQGAGRNDHTVSPLVSLKYLVSPALTIGLDYRNVSFGSTGLGVLDYARNVYLLSVNYKF